jgi:hypothetical protein
VQDISVLRQVANRSLIKDFTARDLETRNIATVVERIEEALTQATRLAKKIGTEARGRAQRIRELRIKRRQEKARSQLREENRGVEIARV